MGTFRSSDDFWVLDDIHNRMVGTLSQCTNSFVALQQGMLYYFQYTAEEEAGMWIDKAIAAESSFFSIIIGLKTIYVTITTFTVGKVTLVYSVTFDISCALAKTT